MAITKTLGTLTTPVPSIQTQTQTAFSENADNAFIYLGDLAPDINIFTGQANTLQTDVNAKQVTASSAATTATDQATASSNSATASATSETNSANSATASATSAGQSEASRLLVDKLYLGAKASDPTLDNQGAALQAGASYLNTVGGKIRAYTGSAWIDGISAIAGVSSVDGQTGAVTAISLEWSSKTIYITQSATAVITNFDSYITYSVSALLGTVSVSGNTLNYTAPGTAGSEVITINGRDISFDILAAGIEAPTVQSPANGSTDNNGSVIVSLSSFVVTPAGFDSHVGTRLLVATDSSFTTVIADISITTGDLTAPTVTGLTESTIYYAKAYYYGSTLQSDYSASIQFTTKATFGGLIGTAGGQGFGAGVYADEADAAFIALNLTGMTGYTDPASVNYGNYQHTNSSVMTCVPKHYVRIGNTGAAEYATYGANTIEVAGIDQFSDTASATTAGYFLPRAFINNGVEQSAVFVDKYLLSKSGTDAVSVKGGNSIGLTATAGYTPSDGFITGCTGILADSVILCRSRGTGYNQTTAFIYGMLSVLATAHAQAATAATYCAWYDAAGTTNFPKGCNSSLADINDAAVTYTVSPDDAAKGLTGSASNLAKTAHNGQSCGVVDLNGLVFEPALGVSSWGADALATTAIANDDIYVLKTSVDVATLTDGWGATTDAWGDATHMATLYDPITTAHDLGSVVGAVYWGSGANAVFDASSDLCGFIPKDDTSTDATGTNQFGNDYMYCANKENLFPMVGGNWRGGAIVGVFYRYFYYSRSYDNNNAGARASAYAS
jgi:hypothetical protein